MSTTQHYATYVLANYAPAPLTLVRGNGTYVWDDAGRRYLDFCTGIATNALGHAHPHWVAAVQAQAATLAHASNLFRNERQGELARTLVENTGEGPARMFFCNSGTEANEALLKLARLHGKHKSGGREGVAHKVVVAGKAFHGRTFGSMSATPQEKIQKGFRPLLDSFAVGELNDLASFEKLVGGDTAAVLIEAIQGEGGLAVASPEFLHGLRALCDRHDALLLFDEVQCGNGRTGKFLAFQHSGVTPDAFSLAKGLAGGFPMGAVWIAEKHAALFTPGSHGATFGGNPLACAAALAVQEVISSENLIEKVTARSAVWRADLARVAGRYPALVREVRGVGYLSGLAFTREVPPVVAALREAGLLTVPAGDNVIRLLPPLTVTVDELAQSVAILESVLAAL
ncbi:MAG: acetylornithine/succinylornithine family transaminase [Puniceicoccales bacterium]|jgi:acetylornithine aminotransferase/acetylornithine/N-succinyldiaminopimelate aminotransferase|nr:acetylornithine/succinylornithine family transaminase [Puniceicoccales bacterium]